MRKSEAIEKSILHASRVEEGEENMKVKANAVPIPAGDGPARQRRRGEAVSKMKKFY